MTTLISPYQYFADPSRNMPIANGFIYIGLPDSNPTIPENQIDVHLVCVCDGNRIQVTQPIRTGAGGVPVVNGSPAQIDIEDEEFSITVQDKNTTQIFYSPRANGVSDSAETITYMIGSGERFKDWNQAFRFLGKIVLPVYDKTLTVTSTTINLVLKSGYIIGSGLQFNGGDFSHVRITSEDSIVKVSDSLSGNLIEGHNTRMPRMSFLCDMNNRGQDGYSCNRGSMGYVESNSGVINAGRNGAFVDSSHLFAQSTNFSLANGSGLSVNNTSVVNASRININGCCKNKTATSSLFINSSFVNVKESMIMNSVRGGAVIERSSIVDMNSSDLSGSMNGVGITLTDSSILNVRNSTINNSSSHGVNASNGSIINLTSCTLTGSNINNINISNGSSCSSRLSTLNNSVASNFKISNSSNASIISSTIMDAGTINVWVSGSSNVDVSGTTNILNAGSGGILCTECSSISGSSGTTVMGSKTYGIRCERNGRVNCSQSTVSGNQSGNDIVISSGGTVSANNCITTNGSPNVGDVNGASSFNTLTSNGYVTA